MVNRDDSKVETSINPLSISSSSSVDSDSGSDGFVVDNEFGKFDDEGMEMVEKGGCFISDWVVSDESRSTFDDDLLVNVATFPVGVVLSVKGKQVIVEGKEKTNLLSTGCFLWITATRVPLGYVDEIFGTVEKPCYSVRLELDSQVPQGIRQGTQVSLIVTDSVQHSKKSCDDASCGDDDKIVCSSDSQKSPVMPQTTLGTDGLVPQDLELPRAKRPYRHPMSNERGIIPNPVPVQAAPRMMSIPEPMMYPMQHFGNGQNHMNQQPFSLHQPYPIGVSPWTNMNTNPYLPHPQMKHQRPKMQVQKSNVGPSSEHRGKTMNHRGAGGGSNRGFGRGRGRRDDKDKQRW